MTSQLRELRIGPLRLDFPVVQAALSGYSDMPMRLIARRHGAPYTLCEVMLDKFIVELKHAAADSPLPARRRRGASDRRAADGRRARAVRPGRAAAGRERLRRDRHQLRLPGEEGAGPLPRRISSEPAGGGARDRPPRARRRAAAHPGHGEDAPRHRRLAPRAARSFSRSSTGRMRPASRRSPSTAARCCSATTARRGGNSCAS